MPYEPISHPSESKVVDYDALERLVRLRDQGALSNEEFAEQKRILIEGNGADAAVPLVAAQRFSAYSLLQKISAAAFIVGLCAVLYSTFVYDTTISPMDYSGAYSSVDEFSSIEDKSRAISDVTDGSIGRWLVSVLSTFRALRSNVGYSSSVRY